MTNLTKSFKTTLIVLLALCLLGVLLTCVFGANTFATLGKGQQLVYNVTEQADNYDNVIADVKSFLKEKGAKTITVQTCKTDYNDEVYSLVFNFKAKNAIDSTVTVAGKQCAVSNIDNQNTVKVVKLGAVACASAIVVIFGYLALRFLKNNWLANSLGYVVVVLLNIFATYGLVQICGLLGYQYDANIMTACSYVVLLTVALYVVFTALVRVGQTEKKLNVIEAIEYAQKTAFAPVTLAAVVLFVGFVVAAIAGGAMFTIVCLPFALATAVCYVSYLFVAPYMFKLLLSNTEQSVNN